MLFCLLCAGHQAQGWGSKGWMDMLPVLTEGNHSCVYVRPSRNLLVISRKVTKSRRRLGFWQSCGRSRVRKKLSNYSPPVVPQAGKTAIAKMLFFEKTTQYCLLFALYKVPEDYSSIKIVSHTQTIMLNTDSSSQSNSLPSFYIWVS